MTEYSHAIKILNQKIAARHADIEHSKQVIEALQAKREQFMRLQVNSKET